MHHKHSNAIHHDLTDQLLLKSELASVLHNAIKVLGTKHESKSPKYLPVLAARSHIFLSTQLTASEVIFDAGICVTCNARIDWHLINQKPAKPKTSPALLNT
jgi:hypothetical protein